jgi:hypothetical protein
MKYCVLAIFYLVCLIDCAYSQDSRDILEGKNFCAENPESRYDSIKFFKNDFKLVFKNKKIEDGEWNLRKKPNEFKGYLIFNPNLKNTDEKIFTIKKNDLSEIINVIIDNSTFNLCSDNSSDSKNSKDTIATKVEKIAELNLTERIIIGEMVENNVVKTLNQVPEFNKKLDEIESENSNADLTINNNIIANKKDGNKSDINAELKNNSVPEILYYNVIQIAAFLDFMNAEKYFSIANNLGYNVKINFKGEYYKIYVIPETIDNINLILKEIKEKINKQAFITNIYK